MSFKGVLGSFLGVILALALTFSLRNNWAPSRPYKKKWAPWGFISGFTVVIIKREQELDIEAKQKTHESFHPFHFNQKTIYKKFTHLGGVDQFISKTFSNRFDVTKGSFTSARAQKPRKISDKKFSEWGSKNWDHKLAKFNETKKFLAFAKAIKRAINQIEFKKARKIE